MRAAGIFLIGFAAGVISLAAALWAFGGLRLPQAEADRTMPGAPPVPDTNAPMPQAPVTVPSQDNADRSAAEPKPAENETPDQADLARRNLLFPVQGVAPSQTLDTFDQGRPGGRKHEATDIMAPRGTPVLAVDEGNVVKLFDSKQGGLTVYQFDNSQTYCYYYAHLDRYAPGLKEGVLLRKGDTLGYVGSTGDAAPDAPHLHFAIFKLGPEKKWWEGTPINAFPLLVHAPGR